MKNKIKRGQQIRLFIANLITFALIFISLGLIIYGLLLKSAYANVDAMIMRQKTEFSNKPEKPYNNEKQPNEGPDGGFKFRLFQVEWSLTGEILNKNSQIENLSSLSQLKLETDNLEKISTVSLKEDGTFRTMTFQLEENTKLFREKGVSYIQVLVNVNAEIVAISNFQKILLVSLVIFWLISIIVSYILSRINMKPVLKSWKKQQEFVENASHELRTPLTVIQSQLEKLLTKPKDRIWDQTEPISISLNETRRLNQLTTDLLLLARTDSDMTMIEREKVILQLFLPEVLSPYSEIAKSQGKLFQYEVFGDEEVHIDKKRMHQLLVILLDNGLKYTNEGDSIFVHSNISGRNWVIKVVDTGRGVEEESKKYIFERFYREEKSRNRELGGNGLGLAIAKWIVESHAGTIEVSNNNPRGSIFKIIIPI